MMKKKVQDTEVLLDAQKEIEVEAGQPDKEETLRS